MSTEKLLVYNFVSHFVIKIFLWIKEQRNSQILT